MSNNMPEIALERLPVYLNYLRSLPEVGNTYISSGAIAVALNMGEVLVRKDLAYTSAVGKPKVGYVTKELIFAIEQFLLCNELKNAILVGVGGLGKAILSYNGFEKFGINMVAGFDSAPEKIGTQICNKTVYSIDDLQKTVKQYNATVAVITVPAKAAQSIADKLIEAGITKILSFAAVQINVPPSVTVKYIDVAGSLAVLSAINN